MWNELEDNMEPFLMVKDWLKDKRITVLDFPAQFPDLNPIEMLWNGSDIVIKKEKPKNEDDLMMTIKKA